jgi:hypothetical protein
MPSARFEPAIAIKRPQTYALDCTPTGSGYLINSLYNKKELVIPAVRGIQSYYVIFFFDICTTKRPCQ